MEVKEFIDKLEDFVYHITPDIEELEVVMVAISKELSARYLSTSSNKKYTAPQATPKLRKTCYIEGSFCLYDENKMCEDC